MYKNNQEIFITNSSNFSTVTSRSAPPFPNLKKILNQRHLKSNIEKPNSLSDNHFNLDRVEKKIVATNLFLGCWVSRVFPVGISFPESQKNSNRWRKRSACSH